MKMNSNWAIFKTSCVL